MSGDPDQASTLRRAADEALRYREQLPASRQAPLHDFAAMRKIFSEPTPEHGAASDAVIADLVRRADGGLNAMSGARFFGWVIGGSHPAGVAADWLTSAWGQNCGNLQASPAGAAAEDVAANWLLDLLNLPRESSIGFVTGATVANFVGLAAARGAVLRKQGWDVERNGLFGAPEITVLIGEDAHATVFSALQFLGLGYERVARVATDDQGRIQIAAFRDALEKCRGPVIAIAQAGQINTGAFDPIGEMAKMTRARSAWLHVDGAFGLWARACPSRAHLADGMELADSWATDGHKWLQTPYDCGYAIVKDADAHRSAMAIAASYLPASAAHERDPAHYVPELSRRARGFPTWAMIKALGRDGIADMIERHCALARRMAEKLRKAEGVEVIGALDLNQFVARFGADLSPEESDAMTKAVISEIQRDGVCFLGGGAWRGRQVMRVSVISWATTESDIDASVDAILSAYARVRLKNAR
ncbi:pyridoxal phosphate-dependent decarboxylase family protein [Terrarubrum flagellatum]|uniref:pyridoxal phosphate-dependent decarboxylase family protein n=1 Tax=Terrirubrum flagellatum TaxID=2895980 RepID=UPI0031450BA5